MQFYGVQVGVRQMQMPRLQPYQLDVFTSFKFSFYTANTIDKIAVLAISLKSKYCSRFYERPIYDTVNSTKKNQHGIKLS